MIEILFADFSVFFFAFSRKEKKKHERNWENDEQVYSFVAPSNSSFTFHFWTQMQFNFLFSLLCVLSHFDSELRSFLHTDSCAIFFYLLMEKFSHTWLYVVKNDEILMMKKIHRTWRFSFVDRENRMKASGKTSSLFFFVSRTRNRNSLIRSLKNYLTTNTWKKKHATKTKEVLKTIFSIWFDFVWNCRD